MVMRSSCWRANVSIYSISMGIGVSLPRHKQGHFFCFVSHVYDFAVGREADAEAKASRTLLGKPSGITKQKWQ
jgi:hypothetical protein